MSFLIKNNYYKKDLDIIIVTYKAFNSLVKALQSVFSEKDLNFNVIVFPNYRLLEEEIKTLVNYQVNIVDNDKNFGISKSMNMAVEMAVSDYFVKLDDDAILNPECLKQLLLTIGDEQVATVGTKILQEDGVKIQSAEVFIPLLEQVGCGEIDKGQRNYVKACDALISACQIYNKKVFQEMEGFSEEYYPTQFEDGDFCLRLRKYTNYKVIYNGLASIRHENLKRTSHESIKNNLEKFLIKWNFFEELPFENTNDLDLEFYQVVKLLFNGESKEAQEKTKNIKERYNVENPFLNFVVEYSNKKDISFKLEGSREEKLEKYFIIIKLLEIYKKDFA